MRKTLLVILLALVLTCTFAVMAVPGSAEVSSDVTYDFGYIQKDGGGYFGNADGADLTGGESLTMEFDLIAANFPNANYNNGIIVGDHNGSSLNDPYTQGQTFYWHSNWAYFDQRHCWAGYLDNVSIGISRLEEMGAQFNYDTLFDTTEIFKAGKSIRIVYTSYTATAGANIEIFTKDVDAPETDYVVASSVLNIPKEVAPAESNVYVSWYVGGSAVQNYSGTFKNYKVYDSKGINYNRINVGPNMDINKNDGKEAVLSAQYDVTFNKLSGNGLNGWFGSERGVDLNDGESLTMAFNVEDAKFPYGNINAGFILNGTSLTPGSVWAQFGSSGVLFYGNPAYGASEMIGKVAGEGGKGGVVTGDLNPRDIFKKGNSVKVVYTYRTTGSSLEIYTKYKLDDEFAILSKIENLTATPSNDVSIYAYFDSGMVTASSYTLSINQYAITKSDGTTVGKLAHSETCNLASESSAGGEIDRVLMISGIGSNGEVGGTTWFPNITIDNKDTLEFEIANGNSFKIALQEGERKLVNANTPMLTAATVDYKYYKVMFTDSTAMLLGRNMDTENYKTVDEIDFTAKEFSIGIRAESKEALANILYLNNAVLVVDGEAFNFMFDEVMLPLGTSYYADNSGIAQVLPDTYIVNFAYMDGTVIESQEIGYGNNARIPDGEWLNLAEAEKAAKFIDKDKVIFLVREGDNLDGVFVSVQEGTMDVTTNYGNQFGVFDIGTEITVTARDTNTREIYYGWSDGTQIVSTEKSYTFTVSGNTSLTAVFELEKYNVTINGGYFQGMSIEDTELVVYYNTVLTAVAVDKEGYTFGGWSNGDRIVYRRPTYRVTITGELNLTAVYTPKKYEITAVNGIESLSGLSTGNVDYDSYAILTPVAPDADMTFIGWSMTDNGEDIFTTDEELQVLVKGAATYYAIFYYEPVTVTVENGVLSSGHTSLVFDKGMTVTVIADAPVEGMEFYRWGNGNYAVSEDSEYTFVVDDTVVLTAIYRTARLDMVAVNGTVNDVNNIVAKYGDEVTYVADEPEFGYTFAGWSNGRVIVSMNSEYTFTATADLTLTATYTEDFFTLTVENGFVHGKPNMDVAYGSAVNVVANLPEYGYYFAGWYVDDELVSSDDVYAVTVWDDMTITARYEKLNYTLTVTNGTIQGEDETSIRLPYLSQVTVVAAPALENYVFTGWSIGEANADIVSRRATYTFNLERDLTLTAVYQRAHFVVNVIDGTIDGLSSKYVELGEEVTVVAINKVGHTFKGWSNGTAIVSTDKTYTFEVDGAITMKAVFDKLSYTVTVEGGTISPDKVTSKEIVFGDKVTLIANSTTNFEGWYVGDEKVSADATYTFTVDGDVTVTAKYNTASGCGCSCGTFAGPTDKTNGGNLMIIGILALALLGFIIARNSKKLVKFAPKALGVILCVAICFSAVAMVPGAVATGLVDGAAETSEGVTLTSKTDENVYYFPVDEQYAFGSKVKVTFEIKINSGSPASKGNAKYSTTKFWTAGDQFIDDALPIDSWTRLTYETVVIAGGGAFSAMLKVTGASGLNMNIKNLVINDDVLPETMLGGATMWMLPNASSEQMESFVIMSASGELIVIDGGTVGDADYLGDFLHSLKGEVDHWFISHYHGDHIGALLTLLQKKEIVVNNLYYDFPTPDYIEADEYGKTDYPAYLGTLLALLETEKTTQEFVKNQHETSEFQVINAGDVTITVLNDVQNFKQNYGNNTTINFRVDTAGESILFLGDSGSQCGQYIIDNCEAKGKADLLKGCAFIQAAHHGQIGVSEAHYNYFGGKIYLYCAPDWLWNVDSGNGIGSGTWQTLIERDWQRRIGGVVKFYVQKDGLATFR